MPNYIHNKLIAITGLKLSPLLKTYHQAQHRERGSQKGQDLCTFPDHHDLDGYHLLIFLYWKRASQIQKFCACDSENLLILSQ